VEKAVVLVAHLPGYRLRTGSSVGFGPGRLVHLTWEQWQRIDSDYPFQERRYDSVRPLFLRVEDAGEQDLDGFLTATASLVHHALSMRNPRTDRTPGPRMSVGYHDLGTARTRLVGPLEREALVMGHGAPTDLEPLGSADLEAAGFLLDLLSGVEGFGAMPLLLDVMESTARPDITGPTAFVVCIAALEFALLAGERADLRETFARRLATLCASDARERSLVQTYAANLYRLRNDVVHGKVRDTTLELLSLPSTAYIGAQLGRDLVRPVIIRLACAVRAGVDLADLPDRLDDASRSEGEWERFRALLNGGMRGRG
jgi:hypothetical protein